MKNERLDEPNCPPEILDWLPWYTDDALSETQRGAVEAHAAQCAECRAELALLAGAEPPPQLMPDADQVFAKVLARIEAAGVVPEAAPARPALPAASWRGPVLPARRVARTRLLARMAAAAAIVAVASFGWLANDWLRSEDAVYRSASAPVEPAAGAGAAQIDVVFRGDAPIERINTHLRALGAVVVSGPSQSGRYRIALPAGSDAVAAATMLRAEDTGVASFAEPAPH